MLEPDEKGPNGKPLASRALHIIGPDKRVSSKSLKLQLLHYISLLFFFDPSDKNFNRIPQIYFQIGLEQWAATSVFFERMFATWRFYLSEMKKTRNIL